MSVVAPSTTKVAEFLTGVRSDKPNEPAREARQEIDGDAGEFSSLLSKLNGEGSGASDRLSSATVSSDLIARDEREGRSQEAEAASNDANADSNAISYPGASPPSVDPNWSMLLMRLPESLAHNAPRMGAEGVNAEMSPGEGATDGLSVPRFHESGHMSLDQALVAAARPVRNAASAGGASPLAFQWQGDGTAGAGRAPIVDVESAPQTQVTAANTESENSDVASETIRDVSIQSLETHLPIALSNIVVMQARHGYDLGDAKNQIVNIDIAPATIPLDATRPSVGPTKLLTIELEPASLGALTVKMKMSGSSIDMQIRVESMDALRALDATREKLVDAMQSAGCTVDSCTIQVGGTPAADNSQQMTSDGGQGQASNRSDAGRQEHIGREGQNHGGRSGDPRENAARGTEEISRDAAPRRSGVRNGGLYL